VNSYSPPDCCDDFSGVTDLRSTETVDFALQRYKSH
jgi:hypothetical protein